MSSGIISDIWKMHFRQKELLMREENLENQSLMSMRGWNSGQRLRVQEALNDSFVIAYMTACDSLNDSLVTAYHWVCVEFSIKRWRHCRHTFPT